ncbi:MAG: nitronate monooxygenase, partial [Actinomycetota bacterium]|nr:nitronate monooxygenase [Actinomycetota bacterium]
RGLAAVLAAGAAGAWVGTAFLATSESQTTPAARARILAARETGTFYGRLFDVALQIPWPPVFGGRALRNDFADRWMGREDELAARPGAADELADARRAQDFDNAYIYAGQGVGQLAAEQTAGDVVRAMADGAETLLRRW